MWSEVLEEGARGHVDGQEVCREDGSLENEEGEVDGQERWRECDKGIKESHSRRMIRRIGAKILMINLMLSQVDALEGIRGHLVLHGCGPKFGS